MGRKIKSAELGTRAARERLEPSKNPYWVRLKSNEYLGYRKGKRGGSWVARIRFDGDSYRFNSFGSADDTHDADGIDVLNYDQAQEKARQWIKEIKRIEAGEGIEGYTVDDALDDYLRYLESETKSADRARSVIDAFLRPTFGKVAVNDLKSNQINEWKETYVNEPPRVRGKKRKDSSEAAKTLTEDQKRKRRSSANRILTTLKAALNRAFEQEKVVSDAAWRKVKPYKNVDVAKVRWIKESECKRLVNACSSDFRPLVKAALYTGCRYSEITNMRAQDYNKQTGTIYIPLTKNGKPRHIALNEEGRQFFNEMALGKGGSDLLFTRNDGERWRRSHQTRRMKDACKKANINPPIGFHILRHTHASQLAVQGVPLSVIASQLGNSEQICEKHYAHLCPSYVTDVIRAALPTMGLHKESNVVGLTG